ncbi:MAG TPA: type II toxin-antitoxin system VapC family toxin [Candidatus Saccharimonadales bacterium]|nr:type II toxin-antitoxin system VapC family toxin [Candidatus Saccharimonadales bacterium]
MKIAIDTNVYSDLQIGKATQLMPAINGAELLILPFVVDAELRAGFKKGQNEKKNYEKLQKFQSLDRVSVLWPDEETDELYAKIWVELSTQGKPIPTNDVWIAAICLQHNLTLATSDAHFNYVPLLRKLLP